jgi:hypothetical protein
MGNKWLPRSPSNDNSRTTYWTKSSITLQLRRPGGLWVSGASKEKPARSLPTPRAWGSYETDVGSVASVSAKESELVRLVSEVVVGARRRLSQTDFPYLGMAK